MLLGFIGTLRSSFLRINNLTNALTGTFRCIKRFDVLHISKTFLVKFMQVFITYPNTLQVNDFLLHCFQIPFTYLVVATKLRVHALDNSFRTGC